MSEDELDPEELREAEALAEALEGRGGEVPAPDDALQSAALLRYVREGGELDQLRAARVWKGLRDVPLPAAPRWGRRAPWLVAGGGILSAAAAALLLVMSGGPHEAELALAPQSASPTGMERPAMEPEAMAEAQEMAEAPGEAAAKAPAWPPAPPTSLLSAQAALGAGEVDADRRQAFEREMGAYRGRVLRGLRARYPGEFGMWAPAQPWRAR